MNRDFVEMLQALNDARADYLIVGAHALAAHGRPRATGDLDIWVRPTPENAARVFQALAAFGAPLGGVDIETFSTPDNIFQIGVVPCRIDIITSIDGVEFDDAWPRKLDVDVSGVKVSILGREDLVRNKKAAARPKDLADLAALEEGD
ncbi:MAG: hypothetical protein HYY84_19805 [Deltaproteobacteria bacterium]|nr:hypothetical protein [Deltaproteobacteria bacterium]